MERGRGRGTCRCRPARRLLARGHDRPGPGPSTKPPIRAEGSQGLGEILFLEIRLGPRSSFSRNVLKGLRVLVENHRMTALGLGEIEKSKLRSDSAENGSKNTAPPHPPEP